MSKRFLKSSILALTISILFIPGCRKDPGIPSPPAVTPTDTIPPIDGTTTVKLTIRPIWNGAPFDPATHYQTAAGAQVTVSLVKFYLSYFTLVANGVEARLFDADLFDVTNGPLTRVLTMSSTASQELRFGLGLPPAINHIDIATIPPNAPTGNNSGMYWTWASMYRFMLFEGHFDTDLSNTGNLPFNFSFHTGLDTCYRYRSIPINLQAGADDTARLTLNVDISRFFTNGTDTLDLTHGASWHGDVADIDLAIKAADLQIAAFSVE